MRMKLYETDIELPAGNARTHIVAPSEERAVDFVRDHYDQTGGEWSGLSIGRIDDSLEGRQLLGLDAMLDTAPVGFASFTKEIGWVVHAAAVYRLRLFRIEEQNGNTVHVIAPNADMASAVWGATITDLDVTPVIFRIVDGLQGLSEEQRAALEPMLEFGPVGVVAYGEKGWFLKE